MEFLDNLTEQDYADFDAYIDYYANKKNVENEVLQEFDEFLSKTKPTTNGELKVDLGKYLRQLADSNNLEDVKRCFGMYVVYENMPMNKTNYLLRNMSTEQICDTAESIVYDIIYDNYKKGYFDYIFQDDY